MHGRLADGTAGDGAPGVDEHGAVRRAKLRALALAASVHRPLLHLGRLRLWLLWVFHPPWRLPRHRLDLLQSRGPPPLAIRGLLRRQPPLWRAPRRLAARSLQRRERLLALLLLEAQPRTLCRLALPLRLPPTLLLFALPLRLLPTARRYRLDARLKLSLALDEVVEHGRVCAVRAAGGSHARGPDLGAPHVFGRAARANPRAPVVKLRSRIAQRLHSIVIAPGPHAATVLANRRLLQGVGAATPAMPPPSDGFLSGDLRLRRPLKLLCVSEGLAETRVPLGGYVARVDHAQTSFLLQQAARQ
mmetsp:Transcript_22339/g.72888  ORF Transcript_22339/g.72888 Transcript_22339/m.72888 type:complete len:303 (-) Transcript_22339:376-1284(-)